MQKDNPISPLLDIPNKTLRDLLRRRKVRASALAEVHRHLGEPLNAEVVSAGWERGRLTLGVRSAVWASRLRYRTASLRLQLGDSLGGPIASVRIRVLPPADLPPRGDPLPPGEPRPPREPQPAIDRAQISRALPPERRK